MKKHGNWLTAAALIFWVVNLGCACVPEMDRAPVDDRLNSADADAQPAKLNKSP